MSLCLAENMAHGLIIKELNEVSLKIKPCVLCTHVVGLLGPATISHLARSSTRLALYVPASMIEGGRGCVSVCAKTCFYVECCGYIKSGGVSWGVGG